MAEKKKNDRRNASLSHFGKENCSPAATFWEKLFLLVRHDDGVVVVGVSWPFFFLCDSISVSDLVTGVSRHMLEKTR